MTGPERDEKFETGQIRKLESATRRSRLKIHYLKPDNNKEGLCGNGPAPGKEMVKLDMKRATCGTCRRITGH